MGKIKLGHLKMSLKKLMLKFYFLRNGKRKKWLVGLGIFSLIAPFGVYAVESPQEPGAWLYLAYIFSIFFQLLFIAPLGYLLRFFLVFLMQVVQFNTFVNSAAVNIGWVLVRDISNLGFVMVLIFIAFSTILHVESYNYKRLLPKLIIMAVLVNFSKLFSGLLIDISQVFMQFFVAAFVNAGVGAFIGGFGLMDVLKIQTVTSITPSLPGILADKIILAIVLAVATTVLFGFVAILVIRIVMLWIYIILSPLAFVLGILPMTQKYWSRWWADFGKYVIIGPVMAFFLWLGFALLSASDAGFSDPSLKVDGATDVALGGFTQVTSFAFMSKYIVGIAFLVAALKAGQEAGVAGQSMINSIVGTTKKSLIGWAGVAGAAGPITGWLAGGFGGRATNWARAATGRLAENRIVGRFFETPHLALEEYRTRTKDKAELMAKRIYRRPDLIRRMSSRYPKNFYEKELQTMLKHYYPALAFNTDDGVRGHVASRNREELGIMRGYSMAGIITRLGDRTPKTLLTTAIEKGKLPEMGIDGMAYDRKTDEIKFRGIDPRNPSAGRVPLDNLQGEDVAQMIIAAQEAGRLAGTYILDRNPEPHPQPGHDRFLSRTPSYYGGPTPAELLEMGLSSEEIEPEQGALTPSYHSAVRSKQDIAAAENFSLFAREFEQQTGLRVGRSSRDEFQTFVRDSLGRQKNQLPFRGDSGDLTTDDFLTRLPTYIQQMPEAARLPREGERSLDESEGRISGNQIKNLKTFAGRLMTLFGYGITSTSQESRIPVPLWPDQSTRRAAKSLTDWKSYPEAMRIREIDESRAQHPETFEGMTLGSGRSLSVSFGRVKKKAKQLGLDKELPFSEQAPDATWEADQVKQKQALGKTLSALIEDDKTKLLQAKSPAALQAQLASFGRSGLDSKSGKELAAIRDDVLKDLNARQASFQDENFLRENPITLNNKGMVHSVSLRERMKHEFGHPMVRTLEQTGISPEQMFQTLPQATQENLQARFKEEIGTTGNSTQDMREIMADYFGGRAKAKTGAARFDEMSAAQKLKELGDVDDTRKDIQQRRAKTKALEETDEYKEYAELADKTILTPEESDRRKKLKDQFEAETGGTVTQDEEDSALQGLQRRQNDLMESIKTRPLTMAEVVDGSSVERQFKALGGKDAPASIQQAMLDHSVQISKTENSKEYKEYKEASSTRNEIETRRRDIRTEISSGALTEKEHQAREKELRSLDSKENVLNGNRYLQYDQARKARGNALTNVQNIEKQMDSETNPEKRAGLEKKYQAALQAWDNIRKSAEAFELQPGSRQELFKQLLEKSNIMAQVSAGAVGGPVADRPQAYIMRDLRAQGLTPQIQQEINNYITEEAPELKGGVNPQMLFARAPSPFDMNALPWSNFHIWKYLKLLESKLGDLGKQGKISQTALTRLDTTLRKDLEDKVRSFSPSQMDSLASGNADPRTSLDAHAIAETLDTLFKEEG